VLADLHDRESDLVAHHDWVSGHIPAYEARVVGTEIDDLDIGEADATGIVADKDFVGLDLGSFDLFFGEALEAGASKMPSFVVVRDCLTGLSVLF
jgi:hypothetical protein